MNMVKTPPTLDPQKTQEISQYNCPQQHYHNKLSHTINEHMRPVDVRCK